MSDLTASLTLRLNDRISGAPARKVIQTVQRMGGQMERMASAQIAMGQRLSGTGAAMQNAARGQALGVAGVGLALAGFMRPAVQFEAVMSRVGAVSGANAQQLQVLTDTARQLGRDTPWSARRAGEGMEFLAKAGFSVNETVAAMPGLLNLASAGAIDLGRASDIASNILSGFQLDASRMGEVSDILTKAFTSANVDLSMLGQTMKYVAPIAETVGVSLREAAGMAGQLGLSGVQGENAGTALRAMLIRLNAPPKEAAKALAELGVSVQDANGDMRNIVTILAELDHAMKDLGSSAKTELNAAIFGVEAASAASILMGKAGSGALEKYVESLHDVGVAARIAEQMTDNAKGAMMRLGSAVENLSIGIGNNFLPLLAETVERLTPLVNKIAAWGEAHPRLIKLVGFLTISMFGLKVATIAWTWTFGGLFRVIGGGMRAIGGLTRGMATLARMRRIDLAGKVVPLRWRGLITVLRWARFIPKIGWLILAGQLLWSLLLSKLPWGEWIDRVDWTALAGKLRWGSLVSVLLWSPYIFVIARRALAGGLDWGSLIRVLSWGDWIPDIPWSNWFSFSWASLLPSWNWSAIIPTVNLSRFIVDPGEQSSGAKGRRERRIVRGRELGGPVCAGAIYEWQERGRELFVPNTEGRVISHCGVRAMASQARERTSQVHIDVGGITVQAAPGMSEHELARLVDRRLRETVAAARRRVLHDGGGYD